MKALRVFVARHAVPSFFTLAFAISWGGLLAVLGLRELLNPTQETFDTRLPLAIVAMLAGPSVAGLLLTALVRGWEGLRAVWSRMIHWRAEPGWYAFALLAAPMLVLAVLLPLSLTSLVFLPGVFTSDARVTLVLFGLVAGLVGGVLEELGWTGFAVHELNPRQGVLGTGLIVGVLWGLWHFPANALWASGTALGAGEMSRTVFLVVRGADLVIGLTAFRILMVWLYDRTGSLLLVMLMHVSQTASTLIFTPPAIAGIPLLTYGLLSGALTWTVVVLVALAGRRWFYRCRRRAMA